MSSNGKELSAGQIFFASAVPAFSEAGGLRPAGESNQVLPQLIDKKQDTRDAKREADELLLRVQQHDQEALEVLFDKYCRLVFTIGKRVLRSPTEADDLVQEVFLFLWTRSNLFAPGERSGHDWIVRVIYHRAFDRRRYLLTRYSYNSGTKTEGAWDTEQNRGEDRMSRLVSKEENFGELLYWHSQLDAAFEELSEDQKKTLKMFFYEGYTLSEISNELGQPLVNVRSWYYRGLRKLGQCIANDKDAVD